MFVYVKAQSMSCVQVPGGPLLSQVKIDALLARIRDMDKRHREQMRHFHDERCELVSHLHRLVDENERLRQWPGAQSNAGFEF